jgi:Spy/CpxP family protein refolding chaperone
MFGKGECGQFGGHMHGASAGFGPETFGGFGAGGPMGHFAKFFGGKGGPGHLLSELNLTDEQLIRLAELKGKTFSKIARSKIELMELKKEGFKELLQPQVDKAKVKSIVEQLKKHKSESIDALTENLIAFSEVLTADQKAKLRLTLIRKFLGVEELVDDDTV